MDVAPKNAKCKLCEKFDGKFCLKKKNGQNAMHPGKRRRCKDFVKVETTT